MNNSKLLKNIQKYVKEKMSAETTGHDFYHADRVRKNALKIAKHEKNIDLFIIQAAALMHDLGDWKVNTSKKSEAEIITDACSVLKIPLTDSKMITEIITYMSYSANVEKKKTLSLEGQIVQDADRLDALGAIGIARAFAFGGRMNRKIYDPIYKLKQYKTTHAYRSTNTPSVFHFYEKLFLLKDLMNTKTGRMMAERREKFMKKYLDEFYKEWDNRI